MRIKMLAAAVLFLCLAFSLASAEIIPIDLNAKTGFAPKAEGFISATQYEDESMTVTIEAHQVGPTTCHVARVKIADPSQLRSASAYGFNRPQTEMTNTIARRVKAVVAINGDYYSYTGKGYMIRQGKLYMNKPYGDRDVLLIDDIQFISGKESTQEEFFHTFNELYGHKKQIIISSDKPPKEIQGLEERLTSRFLWGLPVDLQSPNYETRVAILKKKIELDGTVTIPDEVVFFIASNVSSNIRELEGSLTKIIAYSKLTSSKITLEFAEDVLKDLFTGKREVTPDQIIRIVSEYFMIPENDICSRKRSAYIVYPRQLCMYLCRTMTDAALSLIGKKLGNRDHTTVLHGFEKIQSEIDMNETTKKDVESLKKKINPY